MITLYTTHCPQCRVLEAKLQQKNIEYNEITDINIMKELNILSVPALAVGDELLLFKDAITWVNKQ